MGRLIAAAVSASMLAFTAPGIAPAYAEDHVRIPNLVFRTGPFSTASMPLLNGQRDYLAMLNERDGGINGVRLAYEECETAFSTEKGVECFEKTKADAIVTQPGSPAIALELLRRANAGRIAILAPGDGFSAMADGKTFAWAFNVPTTSADGVAMIVGAILERNLDSLKGKKIALLHPDAAYGEEPIPVFQALAEKYGFTFLPIPVGAKEAQNQAAQWQRIGREKPDYVFLWGWGAMNAGALSEAVKTKFPMQRLFGLWLSSQDGGLQNLGEAGKGFRVLSWNMPVADAPAMNDIQKYLLDRKKTETGQSELDKLLYQRGILTSMFVVEAIKAAQNNFNSKIVGAEQLRWGLENLKIDGAKLAALGMTGMITPFSTSCADHAGHAGAWLLEWDGAKFVKASDLLLADQSIVAPLVETQAKAYAEAHTPWPINQECAR